MDIKVRTYTYWKSIANFPCSLSPLGICLKKVPNQATPNEIQNMKNLLRRKSLSHWAISSVWGYAIRNSLTSLSLPTWYRYNTKFQFRILPKKGKYKKKYSPLKAPRPNHTWHADITIFRTLDGVKHYVYFIVDNFSKFIINWKIHSSSSGAIRTQTIREAIQQEFGDSLNSAKSIDLIVDGGTENNNKTVEQYIKESEVDITKKIALKDILQSNSLVEATNKTIKYSYLFRQPIENEKDLHLYLEAAVHDNCHVRPHFSLNNLTPYEAHHNIYPEINHELRKNAIKERIKSNKLILCDSDCS